MINRKAVDKISRGKREMNEQTLKILRELIASYPRLASCEKSILQAAETMIGGYRNGGKLLVCGNGGSAADSLHIVGELMKAFVLSRELPETMRRRICDTCRHGKYIADHLQGALPTIALVSEIALGTAYANDMAPDLSFAQQVYGYGNQGDVLFAISTSGHSANVVYAAEIAKVKQVTVVALTGKDGGELKELSDVAIVVPEQATYKIQEYHLPIYHAICLAVENEFFGVGL